jgi:hypothetical protein
LIVSLTLLLAACGNDREAPDANTVQGGGAPGAGAALSQPAGQGERDAASSATAPSMPASMPSGGSESAGGGYTTPQHTASDLLGRKVIRNGALDLEVDSVSDAYDLASTVAADLGGYVAESSFSGAADARSASITLRVPADRYEQALAQLRGLAKEVRSVSSTAQDVTGEVTDLDAALRNLRAVEAQYVELLTRAQAIPDILQVQERLQAVRAEIEQTEGRRALLTRLTDLATITVQLSPVPAAPVQVQARGPLEAAGDAWESSLDTIRQVAVVGVAIVVYSWWLLPLVAVAGFVVLRAVRLRRGALSAGQL